MLSGTYKGLEESVVASFTEGEETKYAGGIYTATYGEAKRKLVLVPLPGVTIDAMTVGSIQQQLNQIYAQAVVSWSVSQKTDFTADGVDLGDNGLDWANSDLLSSYNAEMNSLISAFKTWAKELDPDTDYLFIVPKFSESNIEGFMPRNRRFGFVTQAQLNGRTIAHELGHGAFNLRHTFSADGWNIPNATTDNLMDYNEGSRLIKPQWDLIHNPELTTGLLDDESDGASGAMDDVLKLIAEKAKELYGKTGVVGIIHQKPCKKKVDKIKSQYKDFGERAILTIETPGDKPSNSIKYAVVLYKDNGVKTNLIVKDVKNIKLATEFLTLYYYDGDSENCSEYLNRLSCCDLCDLSLELTPDYVNALYDAADACSKAKESSHSRLIDKTKGIDVNLKATVEQQLIAYEKVGIKARIFLTDPSSSEADKTEAQKVIDSAGDNEIALWIDINGVNSKLLKYKVGAKSIVLIDGVNQSEQVEKLFAFITTLSREDFLSFIISDLDVMAHLVQKLAIPEKYWNPNLGDEYNSSLFYIYTVANAQQSNLPLVIFNSDAKRNAQLQFAIVCGIYNGAVGLVEAVPSGVSLILKLLVNEDDILSSIQEQFKEIDKNCLDQTNIYFYTVSIPGSAQSSLILYGPCAAEAIKKYFSEGDEFQQSHKYGKAIFDIATVFLSYTKFAKALDALDVVGLAIKTAKPILKGSLQAFKCGKKFIHFPNTLAEGSNVFRVVDDAGQVVAGDVAKSLRWVNAVDDAGNPIQVGLFESDAAVTGPVTLIKNKNGDLAQLDGDYYLAELPDNADGQLALVRKVDSAIEVLKKSALATFGKTAINNAPDAFVDKIDGVLSHYDFNTGGTTRKWTRTDLEKMMAYRVDNPKLTPSEKVNLATLTQIRQKLASIDENTILQKILSPTVAEDYFNNKYRTVRNSIARAQDTKQLKNVEDLCHGLALGFDGSPFKATDDFFYVLRFKTSEPAKAYISNTEQLLAELKRPFTGNGFTSGGFSRMGVPELWANDMKMEEAAILKVYKDGKEEIVAVMKEGKFIK